MADLLTPDDVLGPCFTPELPAADQVEAAVDAVSLNPSNAPRFSMALLEGPPPSPQRIALQRSKLWPPGYTIRVAFQGGSTEVQDRILSHAREWSKYGNVDFVAVKGSQHDILVGFDQPGYWSYIGIDCRSVRGISLNLQGFDRGGIPEREWIRVVRHEFGHALSCLHEQQRPEIVARLDERAVIEWARRTQGWSAEEARQQILSPFQLSATVYSEEADELSIMMYSLPAALTRDRQPIVGGRDLTDYDKRTVARAYPGRWTPPDGPTGPVEPPPPPPVTDAVPLVLDGLAATARDVPGGVARFALTVPEGGEVRVAATVRRRVGRELILDVVALPGGATTRVVLRNGRARMAFHAGAYELRFDHPLRDYSGTVTARAWRPGGAGAAADEGDTSDLA